MKASKWTNVRAETIKFLEKKQTTVFDINHSIFFLYLSPKAKKGKKAKINKWDRIKLKFFCAQQRKSSAKQKDRSSYRGSAVNESD